MTSDGPMQLAFVGGTHRTVPLDLRERLAFSAEQAAAALARFRDRFPGREAVLLSTCNRVEFYAAGTAAAAPPPAAELVSFLADCRGIDAGLLDPVLASERDEAVVRHLFEVASGLDSMVLGEPQILAQVKQAWGRRACFTTTTPPPSRSPCSARTRSPTPPARSTTGAANSPTS